MEIAMLIDGEERHAEGRATLTLPRLATRRKRLSAA